MVQRILVINGHPDGSEPHFCTALVDAYVDGAAKGGHEMRRIDLATLDFPLLRSQREFEGGELPDSLKPAADGLSWASHVVIVFPLWLGTMPALLKGFLEQVARPGVAFEYGPDHKSGKPKLGGRSARLIVTMGMPPILYRLWFLSHGVAGLRRSILNFVGIRPVRETFFGMLEQASKEKRETWLATVRGLGQRGV